MAPASKRSSYTEGMGPEVAPAPHNSITVAAAAPSRRGSVGSDVTESARGSPAAMARSPDNAVKLDAAMPGLAERDGRNGGSPNGAGIGRPAARPAGGRDYYHEYEYSDLDEITVRQLGEDILAYNYDLDYCKAQLEEADLTPQETRTLQLRTLDLGHQIRHCKHRIEMIKAQTRKHGPRRPYGTAASMAYHSGTAAAAAAGSKQHRNPSAGDAPGGGAAAAAPLGPGRRPAASPALAASKRPAADGHEESAKRVKTASPDVDDAAAAAGVLLDDGVNTALQRLGFWKCRLCSAPKYLLAGAGRTPAAPCKWPLKDISKMITHFTEMHAEHTPAERCAELGAALAQNRGPFEYWLRRTRAQNISDGSVIDECIGGLLNGEMPDLLRRHSRAAAGMPAS